MGSRLLFSSVIVLASCGSPDTSTTEPRAALALAAPASTLGLQLGLAKTIASGEEAVFCKDIAVPRGARLAISKLEHEYTLGGHHLIAYRTKHATPAHDGGVFACEGIPGPIIYESQTPRETIAHPEGAGMFFDAGEILQVEVHFVNATREAIDAGGALNLWFSEKTLTEEVGTFFMYDEDIAIPAQGTFTAKMHCEIPSDIQILFLRPHMHLFGTAERVFISGGELAEPREIMTSGGYEDLHTRHFEHDPIQVKRGQAIDFECDYTNDTDRPVVEGVSKLTNEMCMVLGGYYPRMDDFAAEWCTMVGSGPLHDGKQTCLDALTCADEKSADPYESERCLIDVCAESSGAINDITNCSFNHCQEDCPGTRCATCVVQKCGNELRACGRATCK